MKASVALHSARMEEEHEFFIFCGKISKGEQYCRPCGL